VNRLEAIDVLETLHHAQNEYYSGGSDEGLRQILARDIVWSIPGRNSISGTYQGIEEVLDYFSRRRVIANATFQLQRLDVLVGDGEKIAALTDGKATIRGVERTWSTVGLYDVANKVVRACWLLPLNPKEFDDIWTE
jgi:ketosteroid isomerase-like protein